VAQLLGALSYTPGGGDRRFESRWCHWNFLLTRHGPGVDAASNRIFPVGKSV
jgi:hypothetical protein